MMHPQARLCIPLVCIVPHRGVGGVGKLIEHVLYLPQVYPKRQGPYQWHGLTEGLQEDEIAGIGLPLCCTTHESLGNSRLKGHGIQGEMHFAAVFKQGTETPEVEVCLLESASDIEVQQILGGR